MKGNITVPIFADAETIMVPAGRETSPPELSGDLWHAPYTFCGYDGVFFASLIYDGSATCIRCGSRMDSQASVSSTRICGSCDLGKRGTDDKSIERYKKAKLDDPRAAWRNVVKVFQFEDLDEWNRFKRTMFDQYITRLKHAKPAIPPTRTRARPPEK